MKKLMIIGAAAVSLIAPLVNGEVVYQNDFATRISTGAVPYGEWREVPYVTGKLVNDGYSNSIEVFRDADLQDNWIRGRNSGASYAYVIDDNGNAEALLFSGEADYANHIIVKHRLGNTFTTGVVTAQCDFKPPEDWLWYSSKHVRLLLGDETFYSPVTSMNDFTKYLAAGAGVEMKGNTNPGNEYKFAPYGADLSSLPANAKKGIWYRVVITANLDTKKYGFAMYEMGAEHPALDAETPATVAYAENGIDFWSVTKGVVANGISSIGIAGYGIAGTSDASLRAKTAQVDNIRVAHNGVECYVNDFSSRRSRVFDGTTTANYVATTPVTNTLTYTSGTSILQAVDSSVDKQPLGFDGWRRLNKSQSNVPTVAVYTNDNAMYFANASGGGSAVAAHQIGQTLTGGKVRICVDTRVSFYGDVSTSFAEIYLGSDAMYNGGNTSGTANYYTGGIFARAGLTGGTNGTDANGKKKYVPRWGTTNKTMVKADVGAATVGKWVRFEILADLDNNKYDFTMYDVCPVSQSPALGATASEVLFTKSDIPCYAPQDGISSFALMFYTGWAYFDNVCVWHRPTGTADETLVYSNDFSTRKACGCGVAEKLVGTLAKNPVGIDGWTRQYRTTDDFLLVGGENPAFGFNSVDKDYNSSVSHDLGGAYWGGKTTVRFDVRAPSAWLQNDGFVYVWLGGDQYHEGNMNGGSSGPNYFQRWAAFGVGLSYTKFAAYSGDGVGGGAWQKSSSTATAGNWYRFVVTADPHARTSDVAVYDMGATHPTLATATPIGEAVASWTALPFRQNEVKRSGFSSIGIQAKGVKAANPLVETDHRLLFDNICVEHSPRGFVLIIQ